MFYQHLFSLNHPPTQLHFTQPLVTQLILCAVHPTPRQHPCYPPTILCHYPNLLIPFIPLSPPPSTIIHAPISCRGRSPSTGPRAPCSLNGTNLVSCSAYATTRSGLSSTPPPGGMLRAIPDFPAPADLAAGDGPAVRDNFKRATAARAAWLEVSAAFCAAILDSIGESNRLAISDPDTDTLHLSPRDIINAMTALHGTMTGAEVDALRLPLKKKLAALAEWPSCSHRPV